MIVNNIGKTCFREVHILQTPGSRPFMAYRMGRIMRENEKYFTIQFDSIDGKDKRLEAVPREDVYVVD